MLTSDVIYSKIMQTEQILWKFNIISAYLHLTILAHWKEKFSSDHKEQLWYIIGNDIAVSSKQR